LKEQESGQEPWDTQVALMVRSTDNLRSPERSTANAGIGVLVFILL